MSMGAAWGGYLHSWAWLWRENPGSSWPNESSPGAEPPGSTQKSASHPWPQPKGQPRGRPFGLE